MDLDREVALILDTATAREVVPRQVPVDLEWRIKKVLLVATTAGPKVTLKDLASETYPGEARDKALRRFAAEVAAAEREACARVAESKLVQPEDSFLDADYDLACREIAAAIRARGK